MSEDQAESEKADEGNSSNASGWSLKWADSLEWLEQEAEADPDFQPKALLDRPKLWPHLVAYSTAFADLSGDRPFGALGGCGAIPFSAIDRYADRYGYDDPDAFDRLKRMIAAQDRVYLEDARARAKKGGKG